MMLRTTISRIKKVCTIAFIPRLLRGEQRCAPGKFEIFSYAVLRKAPKSTKSTDEHATTDKGIDGIEYKFATREEPKPEDESQKDEVTYLGKEMSKENIKPLISTTVPLKESHVEKCQRIIDQTFGKTEIIEPDLGEQYFSHGVNIEETRRQINESEMAKARNIDKPVTDDKFGLFKMSRELVTDDLNPGEPNDVIINESMMKVTPKKGGANSHETREHLNQVHPLNIHLSAKDPNMGISKNVQEIVNDSLPLKETIAKEGVDRYIRNQESIEHRLHDMQEDRPIINNNDAGNNHRGLIYPVNSFSHLRQDDTFEKIKINYLDTANTAYVQNKKNIKKMLDGIMPRKSNNILHTTTATEKEEQLTQKLEHIDETPVVEAQKPNIEGFNVTPRVLGNMEPPITPVVEAQKPNIEGLNVTPRVLRNMEPPITPVVEAQKPNIEGLNVTPRVLGNMEPPIRCFSNKRIDQCSKPSGVDGEIKINDLNTANAAYVQNKNNIKKMLHVIMPRKSNDILHTTTATEKEEQLTQKLEHIDETPLVEAQKPNIKGFNVTPRVLGNMEPAIRCFSDKKIDQCSKPSGVDVPASFDEVAKRCLDSPVGKIDEILLNEMEKLGIPITCNTKSQARSPVIEDDLVQMDVSQQPKSTIENQESDFEGPEDERDAIKLYSSSTLYPSRQMNETILPELNEEAEEKELKAAEDIAEPNEELIRQPSQFRIDTYDKKPLFYNTVQYNTAKRKDNINKNFPGYYIPPSNRKAGTNEGVIADGTLLDNLNINKVTDDQMSKEIFHGAIVKEMIKNVKAELSPIQTDNRRSQKMKSNITTEVPKSGSTNISEITNNLIAELSLLKGPLNDGNLSTYSAAEQETSENAQQLRFTAVNAEKTSAKAVPSFDLPSNNASNEKTSAKAVPSFDLPSNNASNNTRQEKYLKPDYSSQSNYIEKIDKPPCYGTMNISNSTLNEQQSQPKEELYTQKTYAKENDKPPSYYETMHWYLQQSHPKPEEEYIETYCKETEKPQPYFPYAQHNYQMQENKYGNNMYETEADNARNMSAAYMWDQQNIPVGSKNKYMHQAYAKENDEIGQSDSTKEEQVEIKQMQRTYDQFRVPDGTWNKDDIERPNINKINATLSSNKTHLNVSDDIWDERLDSTDISQPKPKQDPVKVGLPDEILNQQLDPYYVLTCNETCPISPKSTMCASETNRVLGTTETIYEKDIDNVEPVCSKNARLLMDLDRALRPVPKVKANEANLQHKSEVKSSSIPEALNSLPRLSEDVSLSELLRRVRERSRIIECRNELKALGLEVEPIQGKCRKAPRCLPTAPRYPQPNPIPPPSFGLPMLKPRPPVCKPRKKPHTRKFSTCDMDLSPGTQFGLKLNSRAVDICPEMVCEMNDTGAGLYVSRSRADLTDEVIDRLHTLGNILAELLREGKSHLVDVGSLLKTRRGCKAVLARDYEPWSPMPSWPAPKKPEKKKPQCAPGCPIPPPRACVTPDPPSDLKPCEGFPKKSFSLLDCFAVSLGENKVYDLGEF